jgi:hypothetical protein
MAQDIGDLLQAGTTAPHPYGGGVPQHMCAGVAVAQPAAAKSPADRTANKFNGNGGIERRAMANKQGP